MQATAAANNLAWILATDADPAIRQPQAALAHAERICQATNHSDPYLLDTLSIAQAAVGNFTAAATAQRAIDRAGALGLDHLIPQLQLHRQSFSAGRQWSGNRE